jgi:N-alpha-acetyl-L-2,4-diaminobutyrate deacetylase
MADCIGAPTGTLCGPTIVEGFIVSGDGPSESKVSSTVDFDASGKQFGYLSIPHSRNESGWGAVHLPIVSFRNGDGPVLVLTGGNHGDEYEGPIALMKLVRTLDVAEISGQVIVIPSLNFPAVMAGTRLSPIDGINMNRAFPGRRDGSVSQMIAHFLQYNILPRCDALCDIHSGGKSMYFSPFAAYHNLPNKPVMEKARAATLAFGAPIALELVELDAEGMLDSAVEEMDRIFVSTELGGGGAVSTHTVAIADAGVRNLLGHFGLIDDKPVTRRSLGLPPTRMMHMPGPDCFLICDDRGIFEILVDLEAAVTAGEPIGRIHFPERPDREPVIYRAGIAGTLIGRTHKTLMEPGDFLALIAQDM